jgi:hypothetical protein
LQAVLNNIQENDLHSVSEVWENNGITVDIPKETILKERAATIKLKQHFFFDLVQELSNNPRKLW